MTFQEYINQEDPARHPFVKVTLEDIKQAYSVGRGDWHIILEIDGTEYSYLKVKDDDCLYTITEDGNKKKRSIFYWTGVPVRRVEWGISPRETNEFYANQKSNEGKS